MRASPEGPSSQTVNALLKLREFILGGATDNMLTRPPTWVLMSH